MPLLRIFLTGATGFIGAAVARALMIRGHEVTGLVRPASLHRLPHRVIPWPGDLRHPDTWLDAAADADVVVHAGYEYDAAGREVPEADVAAVDVMRQLLARGCHAVYTSNAFLLDDVACVGMTEDRPLPDALVERQPRLGRERAICDAGGAAVRVGIVYGGRGGTMAMLLDALAAGEAFDPLKALGNHWSLIHLEDLAMLYCMIVERRACGVFHGVDGSPLAVRDVVSATRTAMRRFPGPVDTRRAADAARMLDGYHHVLGRDIVLAPERSRRLGWMPLLPSYREGAARAVREWQARRMMRATA
ncbi:MAG TPA: NAD-dependent epimerase/dehydratase family protein [Gemmatimonadaceae bacterium]|nr:NAD-dependent epimerase/dehydratase family protein [Gemmatimonadaceae bacterium]